MSIWRTVTWGLTGLVAALVVWAFLAHERAQADEPPASREALQRSFKAGVQWVLAHDAEVSAEYNTMLWRMARMAASRSGDADLQAAFQRYLQRYRATLPNDTWQGLVDPSTPSHLGLDDLREFPPFMALFAYGSSCDPGIREVAMGQLSPALCQPAAWRVYIKDPSCTTHQMMGVEILRERACPSTGDLGALQRQMQQRLASELATDSRLRDATLQRLTMLYVGGGRGLARPVWLNRVLRAQQADGGWADQAPILPASAPGRLGLYFASPGRWGFDVVAHGSNFHSTVQALLLLSEALHPTN